jgi:hypothetical protein
MYGTNYRWDGIAPLSFFHHGWLKIKSHMLETGSDFASERSAFGILYGIEVTSDGTPSHLGCKAD